MNSGIKQTSIIYNPPQKVNLVSTLSIYSEVCLPGLIPGIKAPDLCKLSAVSLESNTKEGIKKAEKHNQTSIEKNIDWLLGAKLAAIFCSQSKPSDVPNQLAIVAGNKMILEANIGGITPDMLILNGR